MFSKKNLATYTEVMAFSMLLFFTLLNINVIRIYKDTLSIVGVGVAKIGMVKGVLELPFSILIMYICTILHRRLGRLSCFLIAISFFTIFFFLFGFVYYPNQEIFSHGVESFVNFMFSSLPYQGAFLSSVASTVRTGILQSPYIFLYIFGEVWVVVLYGFLIWSFIHTKTSRDSVKKHYPVYTLIGQLSIIFSGYIMLKAKYTISTLIGVNCDVKMLALLIFITSVILVISYLINYFSFPTLVQEQTKEQIKEQELKKSNDSGNYFSRIIDFLNEQKNIKQMFIIIICYGFLATLIHLIWFHYLTIYYENNTSRLIEMQSYLNYYIGTLTIILGVCARFIFNRFQWDKIFLSVPIIGGFFGVLFVLFVIFTNNVPADLEYGGLKIAYITILIGNTYYILSRALKYILFDTSKEIFFSWYNKNEAVLFQGKSLVDVLAFKIGKSSGAFCATMILIFIQQGILLNFSYVLLLIATISVNYLWISSAKKIKKLS